MHFRRSFSFFRGLHELESAKQANSIKLQKLAAIAALAMGIFVIEQFAPNFFNYPFWVWSVKWEDITKFWPLFAWVTTATVLLNLAKPDESTEFDGAVLRTETFGYMLTGLWEELMFRWVLIPYSMLGIIAMNWFFGIGLGYVLGAIMLLAAFGLIVGKREWFAGFSALVAAGLCFWYGTLVDPMFFFFGKVLIPIANWTTFGMMESILTDRSTPLFLFGIFAANTAFRNGHKYLGPIGFVNSWYVGMVMVYATLTYGILTAIVLHAIYDIIIAVLKYVMRKLSA